MMGTSMFKRAFCKLYSAVDAGWQWLLLIPGSPFKRLVDMIKDRCVYCTAYRSMFIGAGLMALVDGRFFLGAFFIGLVALVVVSEKIHESCAVEP